MRGTSRDVVVAMLRIPPRMTTATAPTVVEAAFTPIEQTLSDLGDRDQGIGQERLRGADILLESSPPGGLSRHGLDFSALCALNPSIVQVVVSPFGVDGPAASRVANDLTLSALGGQAGLQGSPDRAPVRVSIPQARRHASAQAAAAAVIAHAINNTIAVLSARSARFASRQFAETLSVPSANQR